MGLLPPNLKNVIRRFVPGRSSKFKLGDCVQLKDGNSAEMTVIEISKSKTSHQIFIFCSWTENDGEVIRTNFFHEEDLELFDWEKRS